VVCSAPAAAEEQSHASIQDAATAFVLAEAGRFAVAPQVTPGDLDSRLRLPRCADQLQAFEPPNGIRAGRTVVGVRCDGDKPWKLYVPVQVGLPGEVVVAARPLRRGATVTAADLTLATQDLASLHRDYFLSVEPLVGQRVRRNLGRGDVITPSAVEANQLVKRGAEVTILAANPQVQVRMRGKALAGGAQGERIKVLNLSSEREISATVVARGLVQVTP
jgi:flagella basal body P-ring formation protein FlgA